METVPTRVWVSPLPWNPCFSVLAVSGQTVAVDTLCSDGQTTYFGVGGTHLASSIFPGATVLFLGGQHEGGA